MKLIKDFIFHAVSQRGKVYSRHKQGCKKEEFAKRWKEMKQTPLRKGYLYVTLCDGKGKRRKRYVHQLVLEAFVGPCPLGGPGHPELRMTEEELVTQARIAAKRFCRGRSDLQWEDLLGIAFIAVQKVSATRFRGHTYHKLVRYAIIDQMEKAPPTVPLIEPVESTPAQGDRIELSRLKELWGECRGAIAHWSETRRRVIELYVMDQMPQGIIAEVLGCRKHFVYDTISNFRQKMRKGK